MKMIAGIVIGMMIGIFIGWRLIPPSTASVLAAIERMDAVTISKLVKTLEERFGISATAPKMEIVTPQNTAK